MEEDAPAAVAAANWIPGARSEPVEVWIASSRALWTPNWMAVIGAMEPALTCKSCRAAVVSNVARPNRSIGMSKMINHFCRFQR